METNPAQGDSQHSEARSKKAACLSCRRSKIKCMRDSDDAPCEKCAVLGAECIVPEYHVGRQKGTKNKRRGLDKALYQIEEAIKKSRSGAPDARNGPSVSNLQTLLNQAQTILAQNRNRESALTEERDTTLSLAPRQLHPEDNLGLDDAENPLQMLARASDLQLSQPAPVNDYTSLSPLSRSSVTGRATSTREKSDVHWFFAPIRANPDYGNEMSHDIDPIDLGLATLEEAESLFTFFFQNLSHTRWGLDPRVHTFDFVRTQSAFLFTSILAASALFLPSAGALSKRLSSHRTLLARRVMTSRHRSVEIVLAFMLNVPWMPPGEHSADDETSSYMSMALTIALDLSLNKIILPSLSFKNDIFKRLSRADCIDGRKALCMDGFDDVDPNSEWGRRLLRRRERVWIALFVLERGVCLARGRSFTVPVTAIIENCDNWHVSDIADTQDGSVTSMAVLRRDLDSLFRSVRSRCDGYRIIDEGADVAQSIKTTIEAFYDRWFATWAFTIGEGEQRTLPPYVEILVIHTRLSTYSGVINHPTAPVEVKRFFRAAGLSSALNVMRAAIQGETRLKSMPNNTAIMISFAACVALSLSGTTAANISQLAPSVRNLIEETANVLERIGGSPAHRNGMSVLYGRYLRDLVRRATELPVRDIQGSIPTGTSEMESTLSSDVHPAAGMPPDGFTPILQQASVPSGNVAASMLQQTGGNLWSEPLQFATMSDDQIVEAVNRAGTAWDMMPNDINLDEIAGVNWLDWGNTEFGF